VVKKVACWSPVHYIFNIGKIDTHTESLVLCKFDRVEGGGWGRGQEKITDKGMKN